MGKYDAALKDFTKAIEIAPDNSEAYWARGVYYEYLSEHRKAIADLSKSIKLNPNFAKAYGQRGIAYGMMNRHSESIKDFKKALELDPNDTETQFLIEIAHIRNNKFSSKNSQRRNLDIPFGYYYDAENDLVWDEDMNDCRPAVYYDKDIDWD